MIDAHPVQARAPAAQLTLPESGSGSKRAKDIYSSIRKLIAFHLRPYSVVENDSFRGLFTMLDSRYKIPFTGRWFFSERVIPEMYMYAEVKDALKSEQSQALHGVSHCHVEVPSEQGVHGGDFPLDNSQG